MFEHDDLIGAWRFLGLPTTRESPDHKAQTEPCTTGQTITFPTHTNQIFDGTYLTRIKLPVLCPIRQSSLSMWETVFHVLSLKPWPSLMSRLL